MKLIAPPGEIRHILPPPGNGERGFSASDPGRQCMWSSRASIRRWLRQEEQPQTSRRVSHLWLRRSLRVARCSSAYNLVGWKVTEVDGHSRCSVFGGMRGWSRSVMACPMHILQSQIRLADAGSCAVRLRRYSRSEAGPISSVQCTTKRRCHGAASNNCSHGVDRLSGLAE